MIKKTTLWLSADHEAIYLQKKIYYKNVELLQLRYMEDQPGGVIINSLFISSAFWALLEVPALL